MAKLPNSKPQMKRGELEALINKHYPDYLKGHYIEDKFAIVGIRGYYANSMGKAGVNDRAMYDDAMFLLTYTELHSFNANCDPSVYRPGIAKLVAGIYRGVYKFDDHHGSKGSYPAICQRLGNVVVIRDGKKVNDEPKMISINIHEGGSKTTSSLGCQTIPPVQYDRFYGTAKRIFEGLHGDRWDNASPTYILIEK
jgi:hypothetical protein